MGVLVLVAGILALSAPAVAGLSVVLVALNMKPIDGWAPVHAVP